MRRLLARALLGLGFCLVADAASAEEKAGENVTTIKPIVVYGRRDRPSASVEVSRARMQLPVTTPTLASVTKIQDASKKDPF